VKINLAIERTHTNETLHSARTSALIPPRQDLTTRGAGSCRVSHSRNRESFRSSRTTLSAAKDDRDVTACRSCITRCEMKMKFSRQTPRDTARNATRHDGAHAHTHTTRRKCQKRKRGPWRSDATPRDSTEPNDGTSMCIPRCGPFTLGPRSRAVLPRGARRRPRSHR